MKKFLICILLISNGCASSLVHWKKIEERKEDLVEPEKACKDAYLYPLLDGISAIILLTGGIYLIANGLSQTDEANQTIRVLPASLMLPMGLVATASTYYGVKKYTQCEE